MKQCFSIRRRLSSVEFCHSDGVGFVTERPTSGQLEYLVTALDEGSWSTAADRLGVTPSALGQGIRTLENRLGVPLFDKEGRTRVPTEAAHAAAEHARRVLGAYDELEQWATNTRKGVSGTIRAGMIDTAAVHHFGDALVRFRQLHPTLSVRLSVQSSAQLIDELRRGEHDVVVAVAPSDVKELEITKLVDEPVYVYGPDSVADTKIDSWGPWVTFPADSLTRTLAATALQAAGVSFDVVAESSQPAVIREMVRLGMGWTVLPAVDAEGEPHALRRATPEPIVTRALTLIRPQSKSASPALQRFIAMMMSEPLEGSP